MRLGRVALDESLELLCRGSSAEGVVRPAVVEAVSKGADDGLQFVDAMRQIVGGVEPVTPSRLGAFDASVEIGALGRQEELEASRLVFGFEDGLELAAAVDLDSAQQTRSSAKPTLA